MGKRKVNWKQIAIDLYEKAVGCGCCCDYDEKLKATTAYMDAIKVELPSPTKEKQHGHN